MINIMGVLMAGIVMGVFYFIMENNWSYWAYVGIYVGIYTVGAILSIFIDIAMTDSMMIEFYFGELFLAYVLTLILSIISYALIGMAVVYILDSMKGTDKKTFVAVGVITQVILTIVVNQVIGGIVSIFV